MRNENNEVYVLGSSRIPFVKSQTAYNDIKRKELMVASINGLVDRYKLDGVLMGDTALGAVLNSSADFNLAREVILSTKLDPDSPGVNLQRACGTGLEAAWFIALKANTGAIDLGIAGGVDTNSDLPIEVSEKLQRLLLKANRAKTLNEKLAVGAELRLGHFKPKLPSVDEPRTHMSMGEHCERMVKEWNISREAQDELAFRSHQRAAKAYDEGFFDDLVIPYAGLKRDGILRADTTVEKLAKLKPAFDKSDTGTLTAGNSTALTDGAASVLIGNQRGADQVNAKPLAKFVDFQNAGVNFPGGAGLLMAPTKAVSQLLTRNKLTFQDFDYFEIHEAFAGQVLCNMAAWESAKYCKEVLGSSAPLGPIDISKLNVAGSSLALGHPFAATGARIVGSLSKLLSAGGNKRGLISICTAGGMGVAAILESV
jgi:acetyl-CoA C-acetyltransferase